MPCTRAVPSFVLGATGPGLCLAPCARARTHIHTHTHTRARGPCPHHRAWDLINEPVCRDCAPGTIAGWVKEMAAYVKGLDSKHLLTVGEEGFYSATR